MLFSPRCVKSTEAAYFGWSSMNHNVTLWVGPGVGKSLSELRRPLLKADLSGALLPVFVALYALVGLLGAMYNVAMLLALCRREILRHPAAAFLANAAVMGLVTAALVTPMTLMVLVLQNWVLGETMCWLFPILQAMPMHGIALNLLAALTDRYIQARCPEGLFRSSTRTWLVVTATLVIWFLSIMLVVPVIFHIHYEEPLNGVGTCQVRQRFQDVRQLHMVELLFAYCLVPSISLLVAFWTQSALNKRKQSEDSFKVEAPSQDQDQLPAQSPTDLFVCSLTQELSLVRYLLYMVVGCTACWGPLMVLTTIQQFKLPSDGRGGIREDLVNLTFMLLAFVSSWLVPILYGIWRRKMAAGESYSRSDPEDEEETSLSH